MKAIQGSARVLISRPQLGLGDGRGHELGELRDVPAFQVGAVDACGRLDEFLERAGLPGELVVHAHALVAGAVECGQEQLVDPAEVVEDQRGVGSGAGRDRSCRGAGPALLAQGLARGGDEAVPGLGAAPAIAAALGHGLPLELFCGPVHHTV